MSEGQCTPSTEAGSRGQENDLLGCYSQTYPWAILAKEQRGHFQKAGHCLVLWVKGISF
jgi:hypothetical protein